MNSALALALIGAVTFSFAQVAKKRTVSKGPRAVALLQLAENGKAHLIPVTIMVNGEFYDASVYKADPVPMALQSGIVYEAEKSGVPQGLFTVAGAGQANGNWFADGTWRTEAQIDAEKQKAQAASAKKAQKWNPENEIGGPPKLKRGPNSSSTEAPAQTKPSSQSPSSQAPESQTSEPDASAPDRPKLKRPQEGGASAGASKNASSDSENDPNRPILRRQPLSEMPHEQTKASPETEPLKGPVQVIAAVSDADGPEPRPYTFDMKPEEQQNFLKKMQAMAADEVRSRSEKISGGTVVEDTAPAAKSAHVTKTSRSKAAQKSVRATPPEFHDVQMHVFDVSTTNEAVLVYTASATLPQDDLQFLTTVVAREDIYGDLHKIFAQTTDNKHLDLLPKYEFIDVVDADGDGRGELLFREVWDSGTAFAVYRVIGDRLWPLFEGNPGS